MNITARVQQDMIAAMKSKDKGKASALRMILSQLQLGAKEAKQELGERQEIAILLSEKKRRQQAADAFHQGGRADSAAKEEAEAALIDSYLPEAIGLDELRRIIEEAINETGASGIRDMGKVMSLVMPRTAGRTDGKALSEIVKKRLTS